MARSYKRDKNGRFASGTGVANFGGSSGGAKANRERLTAVREGRQAAARRFNDPNGTRSAQLSRVRDGVERRAREKYSKLTVHSGNAKVRAITDDTNRRLAKIRNAQDALFKKAVAARTYKKK